MSCVYYFKKKNATGSINCTGTNIYIFSITPIYFTPVYLFLNKTETHLLYRGGGEQKNSN